MTNDTPSTRVVNVINFHGLTLFVVQADGPTEYIYAKPLSDLAGLHWRTSKRALCDEENAILYGTRILKHPVFASDEGLKATPSEGIYIRLDRARMYLARINTNRMKANGKIEAAEALLDLQVEWAEVLHLYETTGEARKDMVRENRRKDQKQLADMIRTRDNTADKGERAALTAMVNDMLADLGYPVQTEAEV